jgi:2-keto-myo-inositol isomerase
MRFTLNHMVAPGLGHADFFDLAVKLGASGVEIRNDLPGVAITDGTPASAIRAAAEARGLTIISINALQRFNQWTPERAAEARQLAAYARDCGARALVLVPVNDIAFAPATAERLAGLREALAALKPILAEAGILGFVEPLGFVECSLRLKAEAVAAIDDVGGAGVFRVVHDTFHHFVAGETEIFPARTGLIHASGVTDPVGADVMRDPHRVLVDAADRIDNVGQIRRLLAGGFDGPVSFEPFSAAVHASPNIAADLAASMSFVESGLRDAAA